MAIVGYMGTGKTTVGRILARALGREFTDLDEQITVAAGISIPEIFGRYGEEHFRELEHDALQEALGATPERVIACGGGVVLRPDNRRLLERAATVFLEEDTRVLYGRTRNAGRPLRAASPREFEERYAARLPLYREVADLEVAIRGRPPGAAAQEIVRWLGE